MNAELTEQLRIANNTITSLYENYFDPSDELRKQAVVNYYDEKMWANRISWATGIAVILIVSFILEDYRSKAVESILPVFLFLTIIACVALYHYVLKPKVTSRYQARVQNADDLKEEGMEYLRNHINDVNCMTPDYWFPLATHYMYKIASTGRAETLNQVLAMTDEQLHRWKLEGSYTKMLEEQQRQGAILKQISIDTAINTVSNAMRR